MKVNARLITRTAILLALCIASQFLKNTSIFITGPIVNAILVIATLSCGFLGGGIIALVSPFTAWMITGNPIMSAVPTVPFAIALGNLILVAVVWFFAVWLKKRTPATERIPFTDGRFRLVLIVGLVAAALWASLCIALSSSFADVFSLSATPTVVLTLVCSAGVFVFLACLWMLVARFPAAWTLIAGLVIGSVLKALEMWLLLVKVILPAYEPANAQLAKVVSKLSVAYGVPQLITALIGSVLAFLIWLPLQKVLKKEQA